MKSQRKRYSSDLSDKEWSILKEYLPHSQSNKDIGGSPERYDKREIMNAIFYVKTNGVRWSDIPGDLPPTGIVKHYFYVWSRLNLWRQINIDLVGRVRIKEGRKREPSAGIIDSQSVKNTCIASIFGYDAGKKIKGIKRHIITDILGLLLEIIITPADTTERSMAEILSMYVSLIWTKITIIFADGGYTGELIGFIKTTFNITLKIVKRTDQHTFKILPKRWVVERTFSWLEQNRRLAKNYEHTQHSAESFVYISSIHLMTRRLGRVIY
jgi:transposase